MRGRKPGRAEKYDPEMDLSDMSEMAWKGRFTGSPVWEHVLELFGVNSPDWDPEDADDFYKKYPESSPHSMIIEWCALLLRKRDVRGFEQLAEMMRAALALRAAGKKSMDPQRSAVLEANHRVYERIFEKTRFMGDAKKSDILKELRRHHADLFLENEDADIYRMMRTMGLPRRPRYFTEQHDRNVKALLRGRARGGK
jgi:hypothetical protein